MHANHQIYERALKILENYFTEENEDFMLDIKNTPSDSQQTMTSEGGSTAFNF